MSTVLEIITRSARAMGVVRSGKVPAGADAEDLLQKMQDVINALPRLRGRWADVTLTSAAAYTATDGERIHTSGYSATITLPTTYVDANNVTQRQRDMSRVQIIGGDQVGLWIYAASNGTWARCDALALSDESPFGPEDDIGLASLTAVEASPEYNAELGEVTLQRAADALNSFRTRFYREVIVPMDPAYLVMSDNGYNTLGGLYES